MMKTSAPSLERASRPGQGVEPGRALSLCRDEPAAAFWRRDAPGAQNDLRRLAQLDESCSEGVTLDESLNAATKSAQAAAIGAEFERRLATAGYQVRRLRIHLGDTTVILSGSVNKYHFVQFAIETARSLCGKRRIVSQIEVVVQAVHRLVDSDRVE
jgi:hypothetical protein